MDSPLGIAEEDCFLKLKRSEMEGLGVFSGLVAPARTSWIALKVVRNGETCP